MEIRLKKKLALVFNGVDLTRRTVGEIFSLPSEQAVILIREGWADLIERRQIPDRRKQRSLPQTSP